MKLVQLIKSKTAVLLTSALPLLALAQTRAPIGKGKVQNLQELLQVFDRFIGWAQAILFVLAAVFALYAAFIFITQGHDAAAVDKARRVLIYAAVGVAVAVLAYAIVPLICGITLGGACSQTS